jgi:hypothetical protein
VATLAAMENCRKSGNSEWLDKHETTLDIFERWLPSGSGIDCGTTIDREATTRNKLVLKFSYHHMNDNGMYCGWSEYKFTVKPCLLFGIELTISGRDKNGLKDYLYEVYSHALQSLVWQTEDCVWHYGLYENRHISE